MERYRAFDWTIGSAVPLPELRPAAGGGEPDLLLRVEAPGAAAAGAGEWTTLSRDGEGAPWILWRREGEVRTLRFPGLADFLVEGGGRSVRCLPAEGIPPETLRHLFLDTVLPCVLAHRGRLVLHGAAVGAAAGAVAFVGDSGAGKSTLAAAFAARGHPCVGDDALLVEEAGGAVRVVPAYPGLRLWPDSPALPGPPGAAGSPGPVPVAHYSDKLRLGLADAGFSPAEGPLPLRRLLLLPLPGARRAPAVRVDPLPRREALVALVERSFFLDPADPARMEGEFLRMASSPLLGLVRGLSYPLGGEHLGSVIDAVLAEAGA